MKSKMKKYLFAILCCLILFGCNDNDDENNQEQEQIQFNCCNNTTLDSMNVDNLDQSQGVIQTYDVITVNGDGINDFFYFDNIQFYNNITVTIFNSENEIIYSNSNYGASFNDIFPEDTNNTIHEEGTYRYKIVIENEATFVKNGFLCLIKPIDINQASNYQGLFTNCSIMDANDPFIL